MNILSFTEPIRVGVRKMVSGESFTAKNEQQNFQNKALLVRQMSIEPIRNCQF